MTEIRKVRDITISDCVDEIANPVNLYYASFIHPWTEMRNAAESIPLNLTPMGFRRKEELTTLGVFSPSGFANDDYE